MNFENLKTEPYRLLLNLTNKRNLIKSDKYVDLSNLSMCYTWKYLKKSCKDNRFNPNKVGLFGSSFSWDGEGGGGSV